MNNPTQEEEEFIQQVMGEFDKDIAERTWPLTYLVFGKEAVSTYHLQGYVELSKKISLSKMKTFLSRAHWEKAKGNSLQASSYCKKDGDFQEGGLLMKQGQRSDLEEIKSKIESGASEMEIASEHFSKWVVYRRSFQAYATLISPIRKWETQCHVYWGKTGTGKTRFVMDQVMDQEYYSPGDYDWFDGYAGQPIVIIDDFRGEYKLQFLLKLLDRYPMSVKVKGSFANWCPKKVYITSNIHPSKWYPDADPYSMMALYRRLTVVEAVFDKLYLD